MSSTRPRAAYPAFGTIMSSPSEFFAMDRGALGYRLAEDMLLGKDEHCKNYIRAWRKGEMKAGAAK